MRILFKILAVALVAISIWSCNTQGCTENRSAVPLAEFYSYNTGEKITLDSLRVHGIGVKGDSAIVHTGERVGQTYLPMRGDDPSVSWCFSYKWYGLDFPELNDTVTFVYTAKPWFASNDCGAMYLYDITEFTYTRHLIDSIAVTDSLITNANIAQIQIYFRTGEDDTEGGDQGGQTDTTARAQNVKSKLLR